MSGRPYQRYVLVLLTVLCTLNYLDRGLIILLLEPIKADLRLSDTQLGFLTGIAFGLFYATLGIPIARLADRYNRVTITSVSMALWGLTALLCLGVRSFAQLATVRVAAAVGEAGCMPPTYSLLGDYYPEPKSRTRAMTIYMLGGSLSTLGSFVIGGWLNERYGWRTAFVYMGLPALVVAIVVKLTLKEPRDIPGNIAIGAAPSTIHVLKLLWQRRSARNLCFAIIVVFTLGLGAGPWEAAFLIRSHGFSTGELGVWLGLIYGLGGAVGTLMGGGIANRFFSNDEPAQLGVNAAVIAGLTPCFMLFLLVPGKIAALAAMVPLAVVFNVFLGPTFALLQRLVPDEMRATTLAIVMLLANLIGMGLGPQLVGWGSDQLAPRLGSDSLRCAMLILSLVAILGAFYFWRAGKTVMEDLNTEGEAPNNN